MDSNKHGQPSKICPCGSGKQFRDCHGQIDGDDQPASTDRVATSTQVATAEVTQVADGLHSPATPNNRRRCSVCGADYPPDVRFCPRDGATIEDEITEYAGFISYRRDGGANTARLIKLMVEKFSDRKLFLDVDELGTGRFDDRLLKIIETVPNFILMLSPGCLDRCVNDNDWLKREILHALSKKRNIIPIVVDGFAFPSREFLAQLPPEMAHLPSYQGVTYEHQYAESAARKVLRYMNDASNSATPVKVDEPLHRTSELPREAVPVVYAQTASRQQQTEEPLHHPHLVVDKIGGTLLAYNFGGRFRYWNDLDVSPLSGRLTERGAIRHLKADHALLISNEYRTTGRCPHIAGSVMLQNLVRVSEPEWSHAYTSFPTRNLRVIVWDDFVLIPTGNVTTTSAYLALTIVRLSDGERLGHFQVTEDALGVWEEKNALLFSEGRLLIVRDLHGNKIASSEIPADSRVGEDFEVHCRGTVVSFASLDGRMMVLRTSDASKLMSAQRSEYGAQRQIDSTFLSDDGNTLVVVGLGWVEGYNVREQRLVSEFALDEKVTMSGGRGLVWDAQHNWLLMYHTEADEFTADNKPRAGDPTLRLRMWKMPQGELVSIRRWPSARLCSAVFASQATCIVGTVDGEVFALRLPDLRLERQLA